MKDSAFAEALIHHKAGHVEEAATRYRSILDREPNHADSLHLLGLIIAERTDPIAGIALIRRAMAIEPGSAPHYNSLGHAYRRLGQPLDAVQAYRRAAELRPQSAEIHNNLATTLSELGRTDEAVALYRRATALAPDMADIWYNLANLLASAGTPGETEACYRKAVTLQPDFTAALANYGRWLMERGRWAEAQTRLEEALRLAPGNAGAWNNLGIVSQELGLPNAEAFYRKALAIDPGLAEVHYNLGCLMFGQGRSDDAIACHRDAIAVDPTFGPARLAVCMAELPILYRSEAEIVERRQRYAAALQALAASDARVTEPSIGRSQPFFLPYQGQDDRELQALYGAFVCRALAEAETARVEPGHADRDRAEWPEAAQSRAEQGHAEPDAAGQGRAEPDTTESGPTGPGPTRPRPMRPAPMREDGAERDAVTVLSSPLARGERIRLGIVSGFFCDHTLFKLFLEGWLTQLDRTRFEVTGFHTGRIADAETDRCARWCERFVHALPSASAWQSAISDVAPHVLLYPEVGIDPIAGRLAAMRLAPVQCVAWGQPETTGMPTIDYFLSSDLMEPPDGDADYTERLIRLPNLGLCYISDSFAPASIAPASIAPASIAPASIAPIDASQASLSAISAGRLRLGLDAAGPVLWSGQALYKYRPGYDVVFPRIAAALGACQFVFVAFGKSRTVTDAFRDRISQAFSDAGLDADRHVVILRPMSQRDYINAVGLADVILDTIGWSGGKSTLDCLAVDPAIVTWQGRFMRGRHTEAILRRIGCEATIARSLEEYISIAVRLIREPDWRAQVRREVAEHKHLAFGDLAYMRALEAFLAKAVGRSA